MRWLLGYAFRGVLLAFFAQGPGADLVERLNHYAVLRVGLEVHDLQMVLLSVLLGELDGLEHVRLVRRLSVSNVVSANLTVPVLARRRFPYYLAIFMYLVCRITVWVMIIDGAGKRVRARAATLFVTLNP